MGREAGMITVLVLTGVTREDDLQRARAAAADQACGLAGERAIETALPDHVLADLRELPRLLDTLGA
jgi:phosphoglycolate phosphatase-like HAD superfamily hydrolase